MSLAFWQRMQRRALEKGRVRLLATGVPPELSMAEGMRFHLFISHVWATGQDQAHAIKDKLLLMLPGLSAFLDVDDLESIEELERHIKESKVALCFLSRGYFKSRNAMREMHAAIGAQKTLVIVHETRSHENGGAPLPDLEGECPVEYRDAVFRGDLAPIPWLSQRRLQRASLTLVLEAALLATPKYCALCPPRGTKRSLDCHLLSCEKTTSEYEFDRNVLLYVSEGNAEAMDIAQQLEQRVIKGLSVTSTYGAADHATTSNLSLGMALRRCGNSPTTSTSVSGVNAEALLGRSNNDPAATADAPAATHWLLYLNDATFASSNLDAVVSEAARALQDGVQIVLVHEQRPVRGACAFDVFFQMCPQWLVRKGLFKSIATPLYDSPLHLRIAMALVAQQIGATVRRPRRSRL